VMSRHRGAKRSRR